MLSGRKRFLALLLSCLALLQSAPAQTRPYLSKEPTLYVVGYAHLDTQWRWEYPQVINEYLPATMRSSTWKKDLTVIGVFASDVGCPTPLFGLASALHAATLAMGHADEDSAAVCATLEKMAGLERKG